MTPEEAAQGLYALTPRALTPKLLEDYGITATADQANALTRELVTLNLYWIRAAIAAHIPSKYRTLIFERVLALIERDWEGEFSQADGSWEGYRTELDARLAAYQPIGEGPSGPLAVAHEACGIAEDQQLIRPADRTKMLALLIDCVPLESYGELLDRE